ncbi:hypothetical protein [Prevotella brunnea]|uniref:hypothetical protein n=1 Tax=Prevotella brunnea TaxID=2508867 RepID=UPI00283A90C7|nr:hypothetical protein [Prevotella brunnea]
MRPGTYFVPMPDNTHRLMPPTRIRAMANRRRITNIPSARHNEITLQNPRPTHAPQLVDNQDGINCDLKAKLLPSNS